MGVKDPVALLFGMPEIDIFEAGIFLETVVVVRVVFDKIFSLVDELGQKYTDLLETWEVGLPTVRNPPLVLVNRANVSGKVRIVPKFWEEFLKSFRGDKFPKPVDRPVRGSAAKF